MRTRVLVLGGSFAGMTAALSVRSRLGDEVEVTVVGASDRFVFNPSLIWLPFGRRGRTDVSFLLEPTFTRRGVRFVHASALRVDPDVHEVETTAGTFGYDYLVIATGYRNDLDAVPGLRDVPTITTLADAERTGDAWRRFLDEPGDVVIGATQRASCFGAAYEFLFTTSYQLRRAGLHGKVRLTYVTSEPYAGHFGIDGMPGARALMGMFARREGIEVVTGAQMSEIRTDAVELDDGTVLPYRFAMVVPPFHGQDFLAGTPGLVDAGGYVPVRPTYQTERWDDVYAVGIAAAVPVPWVTQVPVGIPKTGFPTEQQAHVAAAHVVAQVRGEAPSHEKEFADIPALCVMDAGNDGVAMVADRMLPPPRFAAMVPGPQNHLAKLAFEKYSIAKMRRGLVRLP
ncbi:NAD(P)/FAD-dependent oxidoreductase [Cellulomonas oligotrophica]|uniref:Sulfide:quinone oxidoreductase n=1 Tax=Cellulomonas oligotrophica TaxID=931536 RepID=A0A7Y9FI14_9CELL|nr:FAD/NAD(P)-binding oxidoreductase [Cellulomonas oligotrophica]NYD87684.1 sulfide:quinone oxidoreductase [Cellulomonas oligotrophica]GIG33111.1 sulfide:quinone reductase [Cellulomonas oligotrophica]